MSFPSSASLAAGSLPVLGFVILLALLAAAAGTAYRFRRLYRQTAARFEALQANMPGGIAFVDQASRYVSINGTMAGFNGLPAADHIGRHLTDVLPREMAEAMLALQGRIAQTGAGVIDLPFSGHLAGDGPDGERHLLGSFFPVRLAGAIVGMGAAVFDVTAQRQAEAIIRREGDEFRLLAEALTVKIWRLAQPDVIRYANPAAMAYAGDADVVQEVGHWREMIHPDDLAVIHPKWQAARETGTPVVLEARLQRARDGMYRWHLLHAVPLVGGQGQVAEWLATGMDIEDQKQAILLRETFLSVASHELKTPIAALMLQMHMLKRRLGPTDPDLTARIDAATRHVERLTRLVNSLLDVSRIISGQFDDPQPVSLRDVVDEVVDRFGPDLTGNGLDVVEEAPGPVVGLWDRLQVDQILTNLLSNALKYGEGSRITVRFGIDGPDARLEVRDGGPGIARADQDRIFLQYQRLGSEDDPRGHGLGLWIVSQLAERMGGRVSISSEPGAGAAFTVHLPLQPV